MPIDEVNVISTALSSLAQYYTLEHNNVSMYPIKRITHGCDALSILHSEHVQSEVRFASRMITNSY